MTYSANGYSSLAYSTSPAQAGGGITASAGHHVDLGFSCDARTTGRGGFGLGHHVVVGFSCDAQLIVGESRGVKTKPSVWTPEDPYADSWSAENPITGV